MGVSSAYGLTSGKVTMPCVMASYAGKDYSVVGGLNLTKGTQVTLDFHKRVNSALQAGVNINANVDKSVVLMAAGLQYVLHLFLLFAFFFPDRCCYAVGRA